MTISSVLALPCNLAGLLKQHRTPVQTPTAHVIAAGRKLPVRLRPLAPGRYEFIGEFHSAIAQGVLVGGDRP